MRIVLSPCIITDYSNDNLPFRFVCLSLFTSTNENKHHSKISPKTRITHFETINEQGTSIRGYIFSFVKVSYEDYQQCGIMTDRVPNTFFVSV